MPYRFEIAPDRRAGCKDKHCKDNKIKFEKGEIRLGSYVNIPSAGGGEPHGSWAWKHWGCFTPKQIENLKKECEDDPTLLDGFDEMPEDFQTKVRDAFEQGHVDDEDWKHDPEMNRPGKRGTTKPKPKKAKVEEEADEDGAEEEPAKPAGKKRGRAKKEADAEEKQEEKQEEKPAPATKRGKAKSKKTIEPEDDEDEEAEPPTKKARGKAAKAVEEDQPKPAAKRGRPKKAAAPVEEDDEDDEEPEEPKPKPKTKRAAKK